MMIMKNPNQCKEILHGRYSCINRFGHDEMHIAVVRDKGMPVCLKWQYEDEDNTEPIYEAYKSLIWECTNQADFGTEQWCHRLALNLLELHDSDNLKEDEV